MGTRVSIEISNGVGETVAAFFINNSHEEVDVDEQVRTIAQDSVGPTDFVRKLLQAKYPTDSCNGKHREGDYLFSVDLYPGDREYVLTVVEGMEVVRQGPGCEEYGPREPKHRVLLEGEVIEHGDEVLLNPSEDDVWAPLEDVCVGKAWSERWLNPVRRAEGVTP